MFQILFFALENDDVAPTIPCPGLLVVLRIQRHLLAVADGADLCGTHAETDHIILNGLGPFLPQGEVVFNGSPIVAMPFHEDFHIGDNTQNFVIRLEDHSLAGVEVVPVEVKVNILERCLLFLEGHGLLFHHFLHHLFFHHFLHHLFRTGINIASLYATEHPEKEYKGYQAKPAVSHGIHLHHLIPFFCPL